LRSDQARIAEDNGAETITASLPPYRKFPKTGTSWGSPQALSAGDWIAIFSYSEERGARANHAGKLFVDLYDQRLGHKLLATELPYAVAPNELFKRAFWIEGGYIILPLNLSLDSFALWKLP